MRLFQVLALAVFLLSAAACRKAEEAREAPADASLGYIGKSESTRQAAPAAPQAAASQGEAKAAPAGTPLENRAPAIPRKLIRTVNLQLEVRNTEEVAAKVQALAAQLGGYVSGSNGQRRDDLMYYSLTLRVPVERLDEALGVIRGLAVRVNQAFGHRLHPPHGARDRHGHAHLAPPRGPERREKVGEDKQVIHRRALVVAPIG